MLFTASLDRTSKAKCLFILLVLAFLTACSFVPGAGPISSVVTSSDGTEEAPRYHLVKMNGQVSEVLSQQKGALLSGSFGSKVSPVLQRIAVGDRVSITIFESAPGGLFSGGGASGELSGSRQVTLPTQVIDQSGMVDIPFAGRFLAIGKTPVALADRIEEALIERAIEPQVILSLEEYSNNTAVVLGEVSKTGEVPLSAGGDRILSVLANAGITASETEAVIRLVRGKKIETVPYRTIINNPSENIYVAPKDTIFVLKKPQTFNVLGAVRSANQYPITFDDQTLAGALSVAGGISENIADRGGVFLFRFETEETAKQLLPAGTMIKKSPSGVPFVYQINFLDPGSFFWLQQVEIRDQDIIYVSNALSVELDKFLTLIVRGRAFGL
ncbi:polysaccharide biosynthesis/export family protein [Cognatishimia sp. 1_MG-2023]|uniref:polysaccharide biosynthesis/export family protein n=1 Tax=Cognatishimia sp. 1_MG-2023 TaxID=3062642 RepID=UPI0026E144AB|nr:polysaccharide biosynthesis/export family protein [Cognatishimia sp. 1_MG-2023]MDO6728349.1 polysaccharide biosynthesis/export family protein [Cognatishimia sp. 1_MG-2023]